MTIKRCPVCSGPIAGWAIRAEFSCHHCHWALSANLRQAAAWAFAVAVLLELIVFAALWLWAESAADALGVYAAVFGSAGALVWGFVYQLSLRLTPVRPQRGRETGRVTTPSADPA
ncbi:hypothetical protein ACG04R_00625 [Roseateles sp. BYS78W]|uniref:DUF983 domain-containing protein n=1 Tax=Pelomonas candidula TaxID=3299025 RepID=A0ABW7H5H7_9BURK